VLIKPPRVGSRTVEDIKSNKFEEDEVIRKKDIL
jgi:hypothetical protein